MYAAESQQRVAGRDPGVSRTPGAVGQGVPSFERALAVEEEPARRLPGADQERDVVALLYMSAHKCAEGCVAKYIYIMDKKGPVATGFEQRLRMQDSAPSLQQLEALVADGGDYTLRTISGKPVFYLIGEMMYVDYNSVKTLVAQTVDDAAQHRATANFHEGFRVKQSEGAQTCAQSGGENKSFHW